MLLSLADPDARDACSDFYAARGCDVDVASDQQHAEGLLRFRRYDLLVADLPRGGEGVIELTQIARLRQPSMLRVVLTAGNETAVGDAGVVVLQMPQPLDAILALATQPTLQQL